MAFEFCDHKFTSTRSAGAGCRAGDVYRVNIARELPVWNRGPTCNTIFSTALAPQLLVLNCTTLIHFSVVRQAGGVRAETVIVVVWKHSSQDWGCPR